MSIMDYGFTMEEHFDALESLIRDIDHYGENTPAMEASNTTLTTTAKKSATTDMANNNLNEKKEMNPREYIDTLKEIQAKVLKGLDKVDATITHLIDSVLSTNNDFIGSLESGKYKLQEEIEVINWTYGHDPAQYLHPKLSKMHSIILKNVNFLHQWSQLPDDAVIGKNGNAVEEALLQQCGAAASITTYRQYAVFTQTQFRGRKAKFAIRGDMSTKFIQELKTFGNFKQRFSRDINTVKQVMETAVATTSTHMNNQSLSNQDRQSIMKMYRNIAKTATIYTNLIQFVYKLHVEMILNRRAILRRLYQK